MLVALAGCGEGEGPTPEVDASAPLPPPMPEAGAPFAGGNANRGPGGPAVAFAEERLFVNCAYLDGGAEDVFDHHDVAAMFDGYLLLPWAPEWGGSGGLTFFDIHDPCAPRVVGSGHSTSMKETHSLGFSNREGTWVVVNAGLDGERGGALFWEVSDPGAPRPGARVDVPGFAYPDGYARTSFSVFWQGRYVYLAVGDNGIFIVDASDPRDPRLVGQYRIAPLLRVHTMTVIGNWMLVTGANAARAVVLDVADPLAPQPIPGADFPLVGRDGVPTKVYASNWTGGFGSFTKLSDGGGGVLLYDLRDPGRPTLAGDYATPGGAGAYVFVQEPFLFVGDSRFATVADSSNRADIRRVGTFGLQGDLDFITPVGNVVVLSVDDQAAPDRASAIAPWQREPDRQPPRVTWSHPADGAGGLPVTSRIGITFSEPIDVKSAWRSGAVRLSVAETGTLVPADVNVQDTILNLSPHAPLAAGVGYAVEIPAGGVEDWSGNSLGEPFRLTFRTAGP